MKRRSLPFDRYTPWILVAFVAAMVFVCWLLSSGAPVSVVELP